MSNEEQNGNFAKPMLSVANLSLVDYDNVENSILVNAVKEFYNFPESLHDFKIKQETEHYVEIEFYNYQKTHCSVLYQKDFDEVRLKKGSGGVNHSYVKLINNLIGLGWFVIGY
jgi:hypothetical protein